MLTVEKFSLLTKERKRSYLSKAFYPTIRNNRKKVQNFQIFIENADDEELVEFYDVIIHPEKRSQYIDKKNKQIKQWNEELKKIRKEFDSAKMDMYESLDKNEADNMLNGIE